MKKGEHYYAPKFGHDIEVTRVAKDESWADIHVRIPNGGWRKRQTLNEGRFVFEVSRVA